MTADLISDADARAFTACEQVIQRGIAIFVEVGRALIAVEALVDEVAFDTFCRVYAGASAEAVRPLLDIIRGAS